MIYLICTPIGNLNDISLRSIEILNSSDLIYAEDTRKAQKIFDKYKINKKSFSFNDHNERSKTKNIIKEAKAGKKISLISDAGAPLISDPGYILVNECIRENIEYSVIPGPSSVINSLLLSGFPINKFMFLGFLPRKDSQRKKVFENNIKNDATLVFFESPKRLVKTLSVMQKIYPSDRRAVICREMTKKHEEVIRGSICEILKQVSQRDLKGEICLLIEGDKDLIEPSIDLNNEIKDLVLRKMSPSEAAKLLSFITKQNKRDLYNWLTKKS
jgi:probable S-adenosylmethionine-dependent methyltransferase, YraL family